MGWNPPSPRIAELIRRGATLALSAPSEWLDELDEVTLQRDELPGVNEDPALRAAVKRTNRANLAHWAERTSTTRARRCPPTSVPNLSASRAI